MKTTIITLLSLSSAVFGNPVVNAVVEKTWERCVISAGPETSTVSCAIGYKGKEYLNESFFVTVPVILPAGITGDPKELQKILKVRLEIRGKVLEPQGIKVGNDPALPEGIVKANCHFSMSGVPSKVFAMVVSYQQPTINGAVYYLPLFEEGRNPKDFAEFSVSVFPNNGGLLTLESKHQQEPAVFATRITIKPSHNELIKIGLRAEGQTGTAAVDKPSN